MTTILRLLTIPQVIVSLLAAMASSFADGGQWWERLVLTAVHPVTAVVLLLLVWSSQPSRNLVITMVALLVLNMVADASVALSIATGATRGDWWLPLIFSVIPLIALPHCLQLLRRFDG